MDDLLPLGPRIALGLIEVGISSCRLVDIWPFTPRIAVGLIGFGISSVDLVKTERWSSVELAPFASSFLALPPTGLVAGLSAFLATTLLPAVLAARASVLGLLLGWLTLGVTDGFSIFWGLRVADGSAVAGRGRPGRRGFIGRTGAEDNEPVWTVDVVAIEVVLEAADIAVPGLIGTEEV